MGGRNVKAPLEQWWISHVFLAVGQAFESFYDDMLPYLLRFLNIIFVDGEKMYCTD
jgi:hypothetical protein